MGSQNHFPGVIIMVGLVECEQVVWRVWAVDRIDGLLDGLLVVSQHWDLLRLGSKFEREPVGSARHLGELLRELGRVLGPVEDNVHKSIRAGCRCPFNG